MTWPRLSNRGRRDEECAREVESYLAIETDENIARGMSPTAARAAAVRKFGNPTRVREEIYLMNGLGFIDTLAQDLRHAARLLARSPGFAAAAILSLMLGIGANTAIFQLLDAVRLRTLPVGEPERLVEVRVAGEANRNGRFNGRHPELTYALWDRIRQDQQAFSGVFAWSGRRFNTSPGGEARHIEGLLVSGDFFSTLRVPALVGRTLTPADDVRGCGAAGAVISYAFWQQEFGGAADVLGRTILLDHHPFDVVGVTPSSFFGIEVGRMFDVAVPLCAEDVLEASESRLDDRGAWWLAVIGRLRPGWSLTQARAHLTSLSPGLFQATLPSAYQPEERADYLAFTLAAFSAGAGVSALRGTFASPLWLLLATTGLVLLIACANLANLLLARASARGREMAVRLAIGASRWRLVRQLLVESLLIAVIGAVLGALFAHGLCRVLVSVLATAYTALFVDLGWNWHVLGFTAGLTVLTTVLFGLAPAMRATETAPADAMRTGGRGLTDSRRHLGVRGLLVSAEVAMSLVLLAGALLFARSFYNLVTVDGGFRRAGILVVEIDVRRLNPTEDRLSTLDREIRERLAALPGVDSVVRADIVPLTGSGWNENLRIDSTASSGRVLSNFNRVGRGFFDALDIALVAGRDFTEQDSPASPQVAIVNRSFVSRFLPGDTALGRTFSVDGPPGEPASSYEIVGIVEDTLYRQVRRGIEPIVYLSSEQEGRPTPDLQVVVRSLLPTDETMRAVTGAVAAISPSIGLQFLALDAHIRDSFVRERLMAWLSGGFGMLAALLAAVGLYGVMSYMVARRTNEIGIRVALGAQRRDVLRMMLGETVQLVLVGLAVGIPCGLAAANAAKSLFYELQPSDPLTFLTAGALLAGTAAVAAYVPARRAARVDPSVALRAE